MFTLVSIVPVAKSICDGTPTPIASGRPASAITSRTTCSTPSSSASALSVTVGCSLVRVAVTPSTAATATFVPPTSTPRTTRDSYLRERGPASLPDSAGLPAGVGVGASKDPGQGWGCPRCHGGRLGRCLAHAHLPVISLLRTPVASPRPGRHRYQRG